jgi:hypothetical protein
MKKVSTTIPNQKERNMKHHATSRLAFALLLITMVLMILPWPANALDFETIRSNMTSMTSLAWDDYSKSIKGQQIRWTGWISDVKQQWSGKYKVLIDMDPPGSVSVQDVYIENLDKSVVAQFSKDQKVNFSGKIKSALKVLGSCAVTLEDASIQPAN